MPRWPLPAASSLFPSPVPSACPLWLPAPAPSLAPEFRLPFCSLGDFRLPRTASPSILLAPLSIPTAPTAVRAPPAPLICSSRVAAASLAMVNRRPSAPSKCAADAAVTAPPRTSPCVRRSLSAERDRSFFPLPRGFGACHARWLISGPPSSCRQELSVRRPSSWGSSRPRDPGGGASNYATATGLVSACASCRLGCRTARSSCSRLIRPFLLVLRALLRRLFLNCIARRVLSASDATAAPSLSARPLAERQPPPSLVATSSALLRGAEQPSAAVVSALRARSASTPLEPRISIRAFGVSFVIPSRICYLTVPHSRDQIGAEGGTARRSLHGSPTLS
ncbi:unnamed protein product [Closterium sp. NIES-65]|nr:unnamed protein product [Closterium sp. NIES-65]